MAKIPKDPEREARWAEERRQLAARVEYLENRARQRQERLERRRKKLRRLTFGLLGGR